MNYYVSIIHSLMHGHGYNRTKYKVKGNQFHFYLDDSKFGYVSLSVDSHQYNPGNSASRCLLYGELLKSNGNILSYVICLAKLRTSHCIVANQHSFFVLHLENDKEYFFFLTFECVNWLFKPIFLLSSWYRHCSIL